MAMLFRILAGVFVTAIAVLQFTKVFDNPAGRWLVLSLAICSVGSIVLSEVFTARAEKRRIQQQEERETELIAKGIATFQKSILSTDNEPSTQQEQIAREITLDDPRIYIDIEPAAEGLFPRTPFILSNRGREDAHKVDIQSFKLCRKTVTFPEIEVIAASGTGKALPTVEKGDGQMVNHDIFHWLMKDWNDNGELVEEWPIPIAVRYSDPLGKRRFEATMTLMFYPIWYMMNKKQDARNPPDFIKRHRHANWEFKDINFKLVS